MIVDPVIDEDADLRRNLAALGPGALRELQDLLTWPQPSRDKLSRSLRRTIRRGTARTADRAR
jgi:hypothetical protein